MQFKSRLVEIAHFFKFETTPLRLQPIPFDVVNVMLVNGLLLSSLAIYLYFVSKVKDGPLRSIGAIAGIAVLLGGPVVLGHSGLGLFDFGLPAMGFLGFLHIVDVFFVRSSEAVREWSFGRFVCQTFAFVNESSTSKNPRLANLRSLHISFATYVALSLVLYAAPSADMFAQVKIYSFAYFGYSYMVGLCILLTLSLVIDMSIKTTGVIFGYEMGELFRNPAGASNIRTFWARWNLAIKDGLARSVFHTFGSSAPSPAAGQHSNSVQSESVVVGELQASKTPPRRRNEKKRLFEGDAESVSPGSGDRKTKPSFARRAFPALLTFAASGLFHEYMNQFAFHGATGENLLFFLVHGSATVFYSFLKRYYPSMCRSCPVWLGIVLTNVFVAASTPLFCLPFIRADFFQDLKWFGVFGVVDQFIWIFGNGY